jgi:hypothetical protein
MDLAGQRHKGLEDVELAGVKRVGHENHTDHCHHDIDEWRIKVTVPGPKGGRSGNGHDHRV